jgi:hypothetical protein
VFSFSLTSRKLLISSFISSMTNWSLSNVLFSFQLFVCFLLLFLLLISSFNALWSDRMHGIVFFYYICWGLLCALRYDKFWRRFHGLLRRMYIVQKLNEIFCRHQLVPFDRWCDLVLGFLYWFFIWMTYLLVMGGMSRSPTTHCVGVYIYILGPSEYVWWNWVHWCWAHIGW